jgi:hypothetical protein
MLRTSFAIVAAGLIFAAVSGTSQAAPIAPLPASVTSETGGLTQVYWRHYGHRYGHYYGHHYGHRYGHYYGHHYGHRYYGRV